MCCITEMKGRKNDVLVVSTNASDEKVNDYADYYRPYELTALDKQFCFNMPNSIRQVGREELLKFWCQNLL